MAIIRSKIANPINKHALQSNAESLSRLHYFAGHAAFSLTKE